MTLPVATSRAANRALVAGADVVVAAAFGNTGNHRQHGLGCTRRSLVVFGGMGSH